MDGRDPMRTTLLLARRIPEPDAPLDIALDAFEQQWLPVIGPTAFVLARRLDRYLDLGITSIDVLALSRSLGLGNRPGRNAPLGRSLTRLANFNLADADLTDERLWRITVPAAVHPPHTPARQGVPT